MNREEKNMLTRKKIMDSAITEFGRTSYAETSISSICKTGEMSKGIIYHYFKDKDDLYLACVKESFEQLVNFLKAEKIESGNIKEDIKNYIDLRYKFFADNMEFNNIFANALLQPPRHLIYDIAEIKLELDEFNVEHYENIIRNIELKEGISIDDAVEYFIMFQESFNNNFKNRDYENLEELFEEHESKMDKMLNIMLYGIIKED